VGGGPAGQQQVYGASEGLSTVMIEKERLQGQAGVEFPDRELPGLPSGLKRRDLARRAVTQARRFGVEIPSPQEGGYSRGGPLSNCQADGWQRDQLHALLVATGAAPSSTCPALRRNWGWRILRCSAGGSCLAVVKMFILSVERTRLDRRQCTFLNTPVR